MGTGLSLLALGLTPDTMFLCPMVAAPSSWLITLRWTQETGQVAKRESCS